MKRSLLSAYEKLHRRGKFPGTSIEPYIPQIAALVKESGARTLLDYGCGAGEQYTKHKWHKAWGIMPTLYDPAVPKSSELPIGQFDGVICTDVLEHVPIEELPRVVAELVGYARMWCFISVCCRPAKTSKNLPGGRNAHVTLREKAWWRAVLRDEFAGGADLHLEFTP